MSLTCSPRFLQRPGLRGKIILPLVALSICLSLAGAGLIHRMQTGQRTRYLVDRAAAIAHGLSQVAETTSNATALQRFVAAMASEPGVEVIVVAAGDPLKVMASTRASWVGLPTSQLPTEDAMLAAMQHAAANNHSTITWHSQGRETLAYAVPLRTRLDQVEALRWTRGVALLQVNGQSLHRDQLASTGWMIAILLGAIATASGAAYVLLRRVVLGPVRQLSCVTQAWAHGDRTSRAVQDRVDELGDFARDLNRMLDELARREEQERYALEQTRDARLQAEAALLELSSHKFALDQHAIVAVTDLAGVITYANDRFCEISRYSREEIVGRTHRLINSGHHPPEFWGAMWCTLARGEVWHGEVCNRAKDGRLYWVDTTNVPFRDPEGRITHYVSIRTDITARKLAQAALAEREQQFRTLVNNIPGVTYRCMLDANWTMLFISEPIAELTGFPAADFIDNHQRTYASVIFPEDRSVVTREVLSAVAEQRPFEIEYRIQHADGTVRTVWERGVPVFESQPGGPVRFLDGAIFDISDRKRSEEEITRAARLDKLTGLPNRGLLLDRLQQAMLRARATRSHYAVMFLDFDRFKLINDSLGHDVGDALLQEIATRLRTLVRSVDSINVMERGHVTARFGGDEFVILLDDMNRPDDALTVAERLLSAFSQPLRIGPHEVWSTVSIGIVLGDASYERPDDLIRDADTAMYEAKRAGKARYTVFDASMRERVQRRMQLESDLRRAIERDELFLEYQPIVALVDGGIQAVEALVRWNHPAEGRVGPVDFVGIAEESDLILQLGEWVLRTACREFVSWQHAWGNWAPPAITINVARKQFATGKLDTLVSEVIQETSIDPTCLLLEVTEDAFGGDQRSVVETMQAVKQLGVRLAIDDFGAGSASFAAIHQLPIDMLKIDRSLIASVESCHATTSLIQALAVLSSNLGIALVAEGVEQARQAAVLREIGCGQAQGYLYSRPLAAPALLNWLRAAQLGAGERGSRGAGERGSRGAGEQGS